MPDTSLSSLFEFLPIGAYRSTPGGVQLRANAALVRLNGYASEPEMLAATQALDQGWYVEPNRRATFKSLMEAQGAVVNFVSEVYRHKTRERIWVCENAYAVRDEAGQVLYYEGTVEDVSDSMRAQQALADSEARWRLALEAAGDGVWDWNIATGEETCSDGLLRMFGYEPGELPNDLSALDVRTHPDDRAQMAVDRDAHLSGSSPAYVNEHRVQCKNGEWKWVLSRGMVVARNHSGQPLRMIGTHTDISGRKRAETLIWQQANFDALTGLPNRRMLRQQLDVSLLRAAQDGRPVAVAFIDLDHFKEVNDTLGHDFGDMLLVQAAQRIRQAMASSDTVARMGGDEFTVVVSDIAAGDHMGDVLSQRLAALLDALSQGFELRGQTVFVSASIGVALYPTDATQVEDLFKHADQALYSAKGAGRNRFCFFTPSLQVVAQQRARLDADLRLALPLQQLEVVYQPIVDMATGQVRKAEALLRWHHPVLGPVSPVQFIPIAETSGLIIPLGDWVFAQAVEQVAAWRQRFDAAFQISVNKSPVQFHRKASLTQNWAHQLAQRGMPGSAIAIEITEGLLLDTSPLVTDHLAELRQAGIDVSLDDFGTGYSSLTYLQKLAIDYIKIDQSFVRNLQPDSTALSLCKAIIVMAHELGMRVVAEGVETETQRDLLLQAGCDHGQGFLFARPMSPAAFEAWMNDTGSKLSFP
jgi:diguanylate cyclase (GGDEF)-like protein/PAS domain S-box-containing protein